jgi:hypothetical protein
LKGKAILSAKQFKEKLDARQEGNFLVWDRENLLDLLQKASPASVISPSYLIAQLISAASTDGLNREMLSVELDKLVPEGTSTQDLRQFLLQNSLLTSHVLTLGRPFYAVRLAQHGARVALALYMKSLTPEAHQEYLDALLFSIQLGIRNARVLTDLEPIDLAHISGGPAGCFAAYPLVCFSILECLGLGVLDALWRGDANSARSLSAELAKFTRAHHACKKPLSDRFAASLIPAVAALALTGEEECGQSILLGITKWVCDQIETGFGLASPYAKAQEEIERIFGTPFDFINYDPRHESLFAVVLADLCRVFFPDSYPLVVNELKAVDAIPCSVHPLDVPDSIFLRSESTQALINLEYPDDARSPEVLEHHALQPNARTLERLGGPLAPLVCGCLCQDRVFTDALPRLRQALAEGWGLNPLEVHQAD